MGQKEVAYRHSGLSLKLVSQLKLVEDFGGSHFGLLHAESVADNHDHYRHDEGAPYRHEKDDDSAQGRLWVVVAIAHSSSCNQNQPESVVVVSAGSFYRFSLSDELPFCDVDEIGEDGNAEQVKEADEFEGMIFEHAFDRVRIICPASVHFAETVGCVRPILQRLVM